MSKSRRILFLQISKGFQRAFIVLNVSPMAYELLVITTLLAVAIPDALALCGCSTFGLGPHLANVVATDITDLTAIISLIFAGLFVVLCFVLDIPAAPTPVQACFGLLSVILMLGVSTLNLLTIPVMPLMVCLELTFLLLACLRCKLFGAIPAPHFFTAGALSFGICTGFTAVACVAFRFSVGTIASIETQIRLASMYSEVFAYVSKDLDDIAFNQTQCFAEIVSPGLNEDQQHVFHRACTTVNNVWYSHWTTPYAVPALNALSALCCMVFARTDPSTRTLVSENQTTMLTEAEIRAAKMMAALLKRFTFMTALGMAVLYTASTMVVSSRISLMRSMIILAFCVILTALGFVYLETDRVLLSKLLNQSRFYRSILQLAKNDWIRALFICCTCMFLPGVLGADMIRQRVRTFVSSEAAPSGRFTAAVRPMVDEFHTWNWTSVLRKLNLICIVAVFLAVGMRASYVFFSWLNVTLIEWKLDIYSLSLLVFVIGLGMFMMPVVPGTAVYIFAGVVLGYQAQLGSQDDVWRAIGIGVLVSSVAKMLACTGQYLIGYVAGKSVRVQRFVAVDRVFTRAMEMILNRRGLGLGKVCILVAGPDFPTSVLCGILKLNIPQMLLGTTPVILVSIIPQVCVGVMLASPSTDNPDLTRIVTAAAAIIQAAATIYFSYRIMETAEIHYEELSQHRPEHDRVAELTKKEAAYTRKYAELTQWEDMRWPLRAGILLSSLVILIVSWFLGADFALSTQICFRTFSITDRIDADLESGGLDGNVWNLVTHPARTVILALAVAATLLHTIIGQWLDAATRRSLAMQVASESPQPPFYNVLGRPAHELT